MYLKSIRANGFKSFADKIDIEIKDGITTVVGPNGSGKSNIVDAVRWVLGEQSVKTLRGKNNMTDVIFSGSQSRNASNFAMVSLTFDNSDFYLNSPFAELEIKRVVYKTGENEYLINNSKVRLKDITDLFLDSGAGKESYNIISQGAVANIINSKPIDRRSIFEEAAGVLKYKKRKEESIRKLDRTKDNLDKINLVVDELSVSVEPLRDQRDKALLYNKYKESLTDVEISLMVHDITEFNNEYVLLKDECNKLNEESSNVENASSSDIAKLEELKLGVLKYDEEIRLKNKDIDAVSNILNDLEIQRHVLNERRKFDNSSDSNISFYKEEKIRLEGLINNCEYDLNTLSGILENKKSEYSSSTILLNDYYNKQNELFSSNNMNNRLLIENNNKIEILKHNISNSVRVPGSVKSILSNPMLKGVHGTIESLIEYNDLYSVAMDIVLGGNKYVLVVDDPSVAKKSIEYLKNNKLGRATFFPLSVIKSRMIDDYTINELRKVEGFIDIASSLCKYDMKYASVIENQLGNIIVVKDIDTLNKIGKMFNYRYRVVTIDGEVLHTGGSMSGGTLKTSNGMDDKKKLMQLESDSINLKNKINTINTEYVDNENIISDLKQKHDLLNSEVVTNTELLRLKEVEVSGLVDSLKEVDTNINNSSNDVDAIFDKLLNDIKDNTEVKNRCLHELTEINLKKCNLNDTITILDNEIRSKNTLYNKHMNVLREKEVRLNKVELLLDNLLNNLNEDYEMSYEFAKDNYSLDIEIDLARSNVKQLKSKIRELGIVNLGAIEEFDRINERYEFLSSQREEMLESIDKLNNLIIEMDEVMVSKFKDTFEKISLEYTKVFSKLFKGGKGILKLTDPDNLLESGIDIVAEPPGKKLNTIELLSGGEKTLTAIALLFSILNIKTVPFVVLDEVEAALDDANVDAFGTYLETKKSSSQFIIITHKKKTMEYSDVLYGITMQESGVSKLVSVSLED